MARTPPQETFFDRAGLHLKLGREDSFKNQVEASGGLVPSPARHLGNDSDRHRAALSKDPGTKPIIISKGGSKILQAYGPHLDYLRKCSRAGLAFTDVKLKAAR